MKVRDLVQEWDRSASGELALQHYSVRLDIEDAARLAALADLYPKRTPEQLLSDLVGAALNDLESGFPYVRGSKVIAEDEQGDPIYEDVGATPRFLALSRQHLERLEKKA